MLKRLFAFLIFLAFTIPIANANTTSCPSSSTNETATSSLSLRISALYPNPNTGESEWIELTNTGSSSADLSNYTLEDATTKPWTPSGTLTSGSSTRLTSFSFALNNSDETVTLKTKTGTVVDSWTYSTTIKGEILHRSTVETSDTTNVSSTSTTTLEAATRTPTRWPSFSEALPNPAGSDGDGEWIELYNSYAEPITLDGLKLDDEDGGSSPHTLSGTLAGESYLLLSVTDTSLTLNNTEDHVRLLGVNNEVLWDIAFTGVVEEHSYAFLNDSYSWTNHPTPSEENVSGTNTATSTVEEANDSNSTEADPNANGDLSDDVTLTEVYPNPAGPDNEEEWIELSNGGTNPVDLGNWTITDASGKSYTFPANTLIEPGKSLVIYRTASGISLNNSNESIALADYTGEVVSEVSYESSQEDESYAEIEVETTTSIQASTSGLGNPSFSTWQWVLPSPGIKNPVWKQIKGVVSEWDGQWLTLFDGLSKWSFESDNTEENQVLFQLGNTVLVQATMVNGVYEIMHSELVSTVNNSSKNTFAWEWMLSGMAAASWAAYELYKKRKNVWTLPQQALN